ncbi:hypothetical protein [Paenibacillus planticolens]|nr:hypothetical protein [Paenibacillus planticolens]
MRIMTQLTYKILIADADERIRLRQKAMSQTVFSALKQVWKDLYA